MRKLLLLLILLACPAQTKATIIEGVFSQTLDHQNSQNRNSFRQRYLYNASSASGPDAPVLFMVCGEGPCEREDLQGTIASYAESLGAHRIALEHRYYGRSQPFSTLSTQNLRFLTTENALQDLASFQRWATNRLHLRGPWIVIGGSYAGSLAAHYRFRFPQLVVGALASSAPVEAREAFTGQDSKVTRLLGEACAATIRRVLSDLHASLQNRTQFEIYKTMFAASDLREPLDFLHFIAQATTVIALSPIRRTFCEMLKTSAHPLSAFASFTQAALAEEGKPVSSNSYQGFLNEDINHYRNKGGGRAWVYQSCTELGYWHVANENPQLSTRSHFLNLTYFRNVCSRLFGIPLVARTQLYNQSLYEPIRIPGMASNILFINGSADYWSDLSISRERNNSSNPLLSMFTVFQGRHTQDLQKPRDGDSPELLEARRLTLASFRQWITAAGYSASLPPLGSR